MCRKDKCVSRVNIYSTQNKTLPLPRWKWSNESACSPRGMCHVGGPVSLCCWQIGHSAIALARLALVSESPCCWVHAYPPTLPWWPLCVWAYWTMTGVARQKDWLVCTEWVILSTWLLKSSSAEIPPFMWNTNIITVLPIQRSLSTYLFLKFPYHQFSNHVTS